MVLSACSCCTLSNTTVMTSCGSCNTTHNAAGKGHLDCLKYLHQNGKRWDTKTTGYAANRGHLKCLEYAHENGAPWSMETTMEAAMNGHFACLQYAHEHWSEVSSGPKGPAPWDPETTGFAALLDSVDCLRYAHEHVSGEALRKLCFPPLGTLRPLKMRRGTDILLV